MKKVVSTGYTPRPLQKELHRKLKRFNVVVAHRRFGKTHFAVNEMIDRGLRNEQHNPQYAYLAPTYGQAKRIVWDILKSYVKDIPGVTINEAELRIDIPRPHKRDRIRFMLLGAESPDSLRGIYLDGAILDEYAAMNPSIWSEIILPTFIGRNGWAIFISTPKGMNHFYRLYMSVQHLQDWYTGVFRASETGIIPIGELEAMRSSMTQEEYDQELECSFAASLVGAYYGKQMEALEREGKITAVPYDRSIPVHTFWDLGMSDTTAIWFGQRYGTQWRWIDYHEEAGKDIAHYAGVLKARGYIYEEHVLPHDARVRDLTSGKTRQEVLKSFFVNTPVRVLERTPLADGINAVRLLLAKSVFDKDKCNLQWGKDETRGIESLKQYEKVWDAKNGIFQDNPKHNWASHGADAFRTAAMGIRENYTTAEEKQRYPRESLRDYSVV